MEQALNERSMGLMNGQVPEYRDVIVAPAGLPLAHRSRDSAAARAGDKVTSQDLATAKPRRRYKANKAIGLTGREYQVLRIVNSYGWCTPEMVRLIANSHGICWTEESGQTYKLLRRLQQLDLAISRKVGIGTKAIAYATTDRGMRHIRADGDALLCDTNAFKDPASVHHFLGLNRIMLQFQSEFKTKYWLSDFEVRSDNSFIGQNGLAKDYDSVGELLLSTGTVRFAVEYERSQQSATRYAKLNSILASEKYLHMVVFFLDDPRLRQVVMGHLKNLAGFVYYVDRSQFLQKGGDVAVHYWNGGNLFQAPLRNVLKHASQKTVPDYVPVHQLHLSSPWCK